MVTKVQVLLLPLSIEITRIDRTDGIKSSQNLFYLQATVHLPPSSDPQMPFERPVSSPSSPNHSTFSGSPPAPSHSFSSTATPSSIPVSSRGFRPCAAIQKPQIYSSAWWDSAGEASIRFS